MTDTLEATSLIRCGLGEGPLWHPVNGCLYVTDIANRRVQVLDALLNRIRTIDLACTTTAMTWQQDGSLLCFHDRGAISRISGSGDRCTVLDCLPDEIGGLYNDVIADTHGRVLCGTQPTANRLGRLYAIEPDLSHRVLLDDVQEPNGLGFSPDGRALYFCDSVAQTIWKFPYDSSAGTLGAREVFFRVEGRALPDGLTVDTEGHVWSAQWNGAAVLRIDPSGRVVRTLKPPASRITSVCFGNTDFRTLYVTSAQDGADDHEPPPATRDDGAVFAFGGCGIGRAEFPSRLAS
ncbi:MAG TPA: SMP-30/gluconolactonase/LRE family protein [Povalibacter sp.]|nr:SMP-30/gluconolactonase/LRE family protein [Povalibacter sp.]